MMPPAGNVIDVSEHSSPQSALDALPAHGGMIYFPPGTYDIPETLTLDLAEEQHVCLAGAGRTSVLRNVDQSGAPLLHVIGVVGSWWPDLKITIRDLTLIGNYDSGDAIVAEYPNDTLIDTCFFYGHGGHAVVLKPHGTNVTIRDCWARDCKRGFRAEHIHHLTLHGNQTRSKNGGQVQAEHVYLDYDCREVRIVNNHLAYGHAQAVILDGTAQHVIANNTIEGFTTGIHSRGAARDMVISSNYIHSPIAVHLEGECDGFVIADNTMINCYEQAIRIEHAGGCGGHAITGNVLRKSVYKGLRGIDLADSTGCVVSGNVFDGLAGAPVTAANDTHEISGNCVRSTACIEA